MIDEFELIGEFTGEFEFVGEFVFIGEFAGRLFKGWPEPTCGLGRALPLSSPALGGRSGAVDDAPRAGACTPHGGRARGGRALPRSGFCSVRGTGLRISFFLCC